MFYFVGVCCMLMSYVTASARLCHSAPLSIAHGCLSCIPCCDVGMGKLSLSSSRWVLVMRMRTCGTAHHKCTLPAQPTPASTQSTKSTRGPAHPLSCLALAISMGAACRLSRFDSPKAFLPSSIVCLRATQHSHNMLLARQSRGLLGRSQVTLQGTPHST